MTLKTEQQIEDFKIICRLEKIIAGYKKELNNYLNDVNRHNNFYEADDCLSAALIKQKLSDDIALAVINTEGK